MSQNKIVLVNAVTLLNAHKRVTFQVSVYLIKIQAAIKWNNTK